ncbi:hypothetical protein FLJU110815_18840 [Flavobacterium jumunjinense]
MQITNNIQIWKGYFTYQDGYEAIDQYIKLTLRSNCKTI